MSSNPRSHVHAGYVFSRGKVDIARHNPQTGLLTMMETNGDTKSFVTSNAPAGSVLSKTQDRLFRKRTGFTPHVAVDTASGITIGGLRARANAGMLWL